MRCPGQFHTSDFSRSRPASRWQDLGLGKQGGLATVAKRVSDRVRVETHICGIHSAGGVPIAFALRVSLSGGGLVSWLTRLMSSAPWEPVILLDCALSLWAILRFRPEVLQLSASSPGSTIMRCESLIIPVFLDSCSNPVLQPVLVPRNTWKGGSPKGGR